MRKLSIAQRKITAEFLANVGVASFASGVLGPIFVQKKTLPEMAISILLGLSFSFVFLRTALFFVKGKGLW